MFAECFENVRSTCPLIHNITNYVTVNDCANMVLACGASPIMADDAAEVEDITTICGGLNINIGTLNSRTITSMLLAGKKGQPAGTPRGAGPRGRRCFPAAHRHRQPPAAGGEIHGHSGQHL